MSRSKLKTKSTFINNGNQIHNKDSLLKYQIKNSDVKNLDAIYIGSKTPKRRRSHINYNQLNSLENPKPPEIRKSVFLKKQSQTNIQTGNQIQLYNEGDYKGCNFMVEEFYGQSWDVKKNKYLSQSYFKSFKSLRFRNVVVKGGDDLRQQIICMQLIYKIRDIMKDAGVDAFIKPYQIIVLSQNSGLLQFVPNSISVDQMKKKFQGSSISKFFKYLFQQNENKIIQNFIKSLAGSSILTFVLKLKDRHNGNILLDNEGNIIHIDFGFILGMAPGNLNFQSSPFKFTAQYVDIMGGKDSQLYNKFTKIFCQGMMALRKRVDQLTLILQIMMQGSDLDCFKDFDIQDFKNSFRLHYSQQKYFQYCRNLVQKSCMNSRTVHYDTFQYYSNGIMQ